MPGVVMRPRDVFARLQFDAQGGQGINFGQDAGARLEIERTSFALDSRVEEFIAYLGQPRIGIAGNSQDQSPVAFERGDRGFHLDGLAAVRDGDHQVAGDDLARAAVDAFGAVQKVGWRAGARKQRRHISRDIFRFAYAGDVNAPAARLDPRDQVGGALEIVFVAHLRAELAEFFDGDVEEDRNGAPVRGDAGGVRVARRRFKRGRVERRAVVKFEHARPAFGHVGCRAEDFTTGRAAGVGQLQRVFLLQAIIQARDHSAEKGVAGARRIDRFDRVSGSARGQFVGSYRAADLSVCDDDSARAVLLTQDSGSPQRVVFVDYFGRRRLRRLQIIGQLQRALEVFRAS